MSVSVSIAVDADQLTQFLTHLETMARPQPGKGTEFWRHRLVLGYSDSRCVYCGCPLVRMRDRDKQPEASVLHIEHLVARKHGGCHREINLLASCAMCNNHKGNWDWLEWRRAPSEAEALALDARRLEALAWSDNHLLRNPDLGKKKATVVRHLQARWQHPRRTYFAALTADHGLIGWQGSASPTSDALAVLMSHGGRVQYNYCILPPARFHDAIWTLIDHNALVRRVDLPDYPDPTPDAPGNAQWSVTFSSVLDVRRRRPKIQPIRKPRIERPMDWGRRLLIEYEASGKDRRPFDWDWVNKHKETDREWMRKQREIDMRQERELKEALARMPPSLSIPAFFQELDRRLANPGTEDTLTRLAREHGIRINGDTARR